MKISHLFQFSAFAALLLGTASTSYADNVLVYAGSDSIKLSVRSEDSSGDGTANTFRARTSRYIIVNRDTSEMAYVSFATRPTRWTSTTTNDCEISYSKSFIIDDPDTFHTDFVVQRGNKRNLVISFSGESLFDADGNGSRESKGTSADYISGQMIVEKRALNLAPGTLVAPRLKVISENHQYIPFSKIFSNFPCRSYYRSGSTYTKVSYAGGFKFNPKLTKAVNDPSGVILNGEVPKTTEYAQELIARILRAANFDEISL